MCGPGAFKHRKLYLTPEISDAIYNGAPLFCKDVHKGSCERYNYIRMVATLKQALPFYLPIHLIPILIWKRSKLLKE